MKFGKQWSMFCLKAFCFGVATLLIGCSSDDFDFLSGSDAPALAEKFPELKLEPGDRLRITVYGEDKLTGEYHIDLNGNLSLPLAGTMPIAGQSKVEAEATLAGAIKSNGHILDPKITVEILSSRPFYIVGAVTKPGEFEYKDRLNLVSAIAVAGGLTFRASRSTVYIQHGGAGLFQKVPLSPSVAVYPGDVINIPERHF